MKVALILIFCFSIFCDTVFEVAGELVVVSNPQETVQNHFALLSEFRSLLPLTPTSSLKHRKLSSQQQWLNFKYYSSNYCNSTYFMAYYSESLGGCIRNGTSSFVTTASALSEEYYKVTKSSFNNSLCTGAPLNIFSIIEPTCNSQSDYSTLFHSASNSVLPLPGGLLFR